MATRRRAGDPCRPARSRSSTSPSTVMRCWMLYGPPCVERGATPRLGAGEDETLADSRDGGLDMSLEAAVEPERSTVARLPRADRDLDLVEALQLHESTA